MCMQSVVDARLVSGSITQACVGPDWYEGFITDAHADGRYSLDMWTGQVALIPLP